MDTALTAPTYNPNSVTAPVVTPTVATAPTTATSPGAYKGVAINAGTQAQIAAQIAAIDAKTPVISTNSLAGATPVVVPTTTPTATTNPTVTSPTGTTTDASGNAVITPPATDTATPKSAYQTLLDKIGSFGDVLGTKGQVTQDLQAEQQLATKTENAAKTYNAYNEAKLNLQQQIDGIYSQPGITREQAQQQVNEISRVGNANLANLAIQAQASQGLEAAARQTIKDKLEAQFQPITDQIDFLAKFAQLNQNDLTESEKFKLQEKANEKKTELANLTKTADDIHQTLLANSAPANVYSALDKINNDYVAGKITADQAMSKMYATASPYGVNPLDLQIKQTQLAQGKANLYTESLQQQKLKNDLNNPAGSTISGEQLKQFINKQLATKEFQGLSPEDKALYIQSQGGTPYDFGY